MHLGAPAVFVCLINFEGITPEIMTDWPMIREAYEAREETVKAICDAYEVSPARLYKKARDEHWVLRSNVSAKKNKQKTRDPKEPDRKALIDRLYKAFDYQMGEFEARLTLAGEEGITEKDARTLGSLARTLEKLIELRQEDEDTQKNRDKGVNIERLREELARRLERMCPNGKTE